MKKVSISTIIFGILIAIQSFSQNGSVLIQPSNDEVLATKHGGSEPNIAGRYARGTAAAPTATIVSDPLTSFGGRGHTGVGFTTDRAKITMVADETFTSTANGTRITFSTTANGTTSTLERMRIDNTGFIGIGTINPLRRLHVSDGSSGVTPLSFAAAFFEGSSSSYIQLAAPETSAVGVLFGKPSNNLSGSILYDSGNNISLRTGGNLSRVTITSAGNVGIGTSSPTAKLDIEGDIVIKKTSFTTAGTYNALNRSNGSSIYFNVVGNVFLNGIAGGVDGMILYVVTALNTVLEIRNDNASAAAADRIYTNTGATLTINGRGGATLIYDSNTQRWRVIGIAN